MLDKRKFYYFDSAATTFMCDMALQKYNEFQHNISVLWGKGNNILAESSKKIFDDSVKILQKHFNISDDYSLILGKNVTEIVNIIAYSIMELLNPLDIILVGPYEHHSNFLPWKYIARKTGALFIEMPINIKSGDIDINYISSISDRVKVVSYSTVSNTNAYSINIEKISNLFKNNRDILIFTDESQKIAHSNIEISNIISGYILSSHKMYGPKNIAGAFIRNDLIEKMKPIFLGGGMIELQQFDDVWADREYKFYSGTFDVGLILAWAQACKYLESISYNNIKKIEKKYYNKIKEFLEKNNDVKIINNKYSSNSLISFVHSKIHSHDIEDWLSNENIIIRSGHMCAQNALRKIGYNSINRISFGLNIKKNDIQILCSSLEKCFKKLG